MRPSAGRPSYPRVLLLLCQVGRLWNGFVRGLVREFRASSGRRKGSRKASDYYLNKADRVIASRFLEEFCRAATYLVANPEVVPQASNGHRSYPLHVFPYSVVYVISSGKVRVLVVRHHRRQPSLGARRK